MLNKDRKEVKIDNKGRCYDNRPNWKGHIFPIRHNNIADRFILTGWDNREDLNPLFALEFKKNDLVRGRPFWKRDSFSITHIIEFNDHQIDIELLKKL